MFPILKFNTIYKSVLWGGTRIADFKGVASQGSTIGESWEVSPIEGYESVVADGQYKGTPLSAILAGHGKEIMGERLHKQYGNNFPLLVKFIDSAQDLSIQVHPDDQLAARRHDGPGKIEMWYSLSPSPSAYLYAGFAKPVTPESFIDAVNNGEIVNMLKRFTPREGDVFLLPPGCIHALGAGNFVLEVQQASDVTYRIFDYNRRDAEGNLRSLHVEESIEAIKYDLKQRDARNIPAIEGKEIILEDCPQFTSTIIKVNGHHVLDMERRDSFTIVIATKGNLTLTAPDGSTHPLPQGHTLLIPAVMPKVAVDGNGDLVTVFIK
ncbi:MAG: mannose-6-phosphate isomerase [Barnesiella sp.]|nr:mannose-6-phosphate isomerase [Bacteroidales bacterium]MBD5245491.1 mannose-6-phosphate isomerase [Barnesiella sp.]MBD5248501.1 mannose-6-phosphate isomerase [Barnesiella sp.]